MTSDWKKIKISDIAEVIGGGTPSTKQPEYWGNDIPWLTPKDLSGYNRRYISNGERNISIEGLKNSSARILPKGSILLTSRAPIGYLAIAEQDLCTNQGFKSLVLKPGNDSEFFYYLLKNNIVYIKNMSSGSTFAEISGSQVKNLEFNLPSLETQRKIARVLGAIDDKIELNNSINKNLEQQMDLLYTNMFIDDTNFVELGSVIETTSGGTPSRKNLNFYKNGTINWIKSKELLGTYIIKTEEYITDEAVKKSSAKILPKQSVLVAMYGATVGAYGIISKEMTCNQAICALIQNERYPYPYIFETIKFAKNTLVNMAVGSAQQNISQILIKQLPVHSNLDKIKKYCNIAELLLCKILNIQEENSRLTQLRDTLLPKLMNEEIDVDKVEV